MNTKERLKEFINYKNIGRNKFEDSIGVSNGYTSTKSKSLSSDVLEKIHATYPELNINWLVSGEGDMIYNTKLNVSTNSGSISQGQTINIELPTSGTEKIIKPDGTVEIQQASQNSDNSGEIARLKQRIEDLERLIQSKDEIICLLKESVGKKI